MVRALASYQFSGVGVIRGLSLLLVLVLAPRGFSQGTPVFPLLKNQHFQIPIRSGECPQLVLCAKYIDT